MDVFISYRRSNSIVAHLIYYALKSAGLSVFLDVSKRQAGSFPAYLESQINVSSFFLLIIGPTCFEKRDGTDWYKNEIDLAIAKKEDIKIIPILTGGMQWPKEKNQWPSNWLGCDNYSKLSLLESISVSEQSNIIESVQQLISLMGNPLYNNSLLKILKNAVSNCKSQSILEYIIRSKEMRMKPGGEIHLLTDNLKNYDFSPIAKIAISRNISNGTKYIYYIPEECEEEIGILCKSLEEYVSRKEIANIEIDKWIRKNFLCNDTIVNAIANLNGIKKQKILQLKCGERLLSHDVLGTYFSFNSDFEEVFSIDFLVDWLKGSLGRDSYEVNDCLLKLNKVVEIVRNDVALKKKWGKCLEYLLLLKTISDWIMKKELTESELAHVKTICKKFRIYDDIVYWLDSNTPQNTSEVMKNLQYNILGRSDLPFIPCYSFSLFLNDNKQAVVGAWYTASNERDETSDNNTVILHDCQKEELMIIKRVFEKLYTNK